MKGSIISTCELETLGMRDPMEQANEFMCDCIILKEEVIFQEEKDMRGSQVQQCKAGGWHG